jgi:hypothetical protein
MKRPQPHVIWEANGSLFRCLHCADAYRPAMPCPVDVFIAASRAYIKAHRACKAPRDPRASPHP